MSETVQTDAFDISGTGTNLKVEGHTKFFCVPLHFCGSKSTTTCFSERFRDAQ